MTTILADITAAWHDRWRHPALLQTLLAEPQSATELAESVIAGLATPTTTPDETIRRLADVGEYAIVRALLGDGDLRMDVSEQARDHLHASLRNARRELEQRRAVLSERARRIGADLISAARIDRLLARCRRDAEAELDLWEEAIGVREGERAAELESRLAAAGAADHPVWAGAVRASIEARQFPAAERRLLAGPDDDAADGPAAVRRRREGFPWAKTPVPDVLGWYLDDDAEPRPEFRGWRPEPGDTAAWQTLRTAQNLTKRFDRSGVREFAVALDSLIGADGGRHPVWEHGTGMLTELSGLHDHRLVRLGLPHSMPLWIDRVNAPPPEGAPTPMVWLWLDSAYPPSPPEGVVVLTARTLFELVAPDAEGDPMSPTTRRINLLRALCLQFPVDEILAAGRCRIGMSNQFELYDDLTWLLDLLGVHADVVVVDTLAYYTGGHMEALRVALNALLDAGRPTTLSVDDLDIWRRDAQAITDLRERVFERLDGDPEVAVTSYAALWQYGDAPAEHITEPDIEDLLGVLTEDEEGEEEVASVQNLHRVLKRTTSTGLLWESGSGYLLRAPGLAEPVGSGDEILARFQRAHRLLKQRRETILEQVRHETLADGLHVMKGKLHGLRVMVEDLHNTGADLHHGALAVILRHARELEQRAADLVGQRMEQLLTPERIDLGALLNEARHRYAREHQGTIEMTLRPSPDPSTVMASKLQLTLAIDNLMINAIDAIGRGHGTGRIRIQLSREADAAGDASGETVVDVEDSGPGIVDPGIVSDIRHGRTVSGSSNGTGNGLRSARAHIEDNGGTLVFAGTSAELGGAHFQIRLPLTSSA